MFKGVEDFLYVLIAAIVLVGAFWVISAVAPQIGLAPSTGQASGITTVASFSVGSVGVVTDAPAKSFDVEPFTPGEKQREVLKSLPKVKASNSLGGSESESLVIDVPSWLLDTLDKIIIEFDVAETNQYGDLVIKWNGKEFFMQSANPKSYRVDIQPDFVREQNTLEVSAGNPGFRFWAATVYELRNFKVSASYGPAKLFTFDLFSNELQSFNKGSVEFFAVGRGLVRIGVNGRQIFSKTVEGFESVDFGFSDAPLQTGANIIAFSGDGNVQLHNAKIRIFLLTSDFTRSRTFNLTANDMAQIRQGGGGVEYDITSINREGSLRVRLNGKELSVPQTVVGRNTAPFSASDAVEGLNTVEFSGTGSFDIAEARVGY